MESVEGLVKALQGWAVAAGLSGIALSALVLGFDVESTAAGVAATLDGLPGTALGTSFGAAILLLTLGLGLAALVAPFEVRPPTGLLLMAGRDLLALAARPRRTDLAPRRRHAPRRVRAVRRPAGPLAPRPERPASSGERPRRIVPRLLAGLAGLLLGAELLVWGTHRTVSELGLSETVFGLLVVAAAVCAEELVLEMLPAYRGFPELSVGNALGTLVFLLTASLGIVALASPIDVPGSVRNFHLPPCWSRRPWRSPCWHAADSAGSRAARSLPPTASTLPGQSRSASSRT